MAQGDFEQTGDAVVQLIETLVAEGLCPCCIASALMAEGAALQVTITGKEKTVEECERITGYVRDGTIQAWTHGTH